MFYVFYGLCMYKYPVYSFCFLKSHSDKERPPIKQVGICGSPVSTNEKGFRTFEYPVRSSSEGAGALPHGPS